ncbi:MAG: hypothetical protein K2X03_12235 [Bryobacteraceae bacterium]|nr:hypothetical protein [Bryobacteraceae bacterium]
MALLAGGDLPWWQRLRWSRHTRQCESCRRELEALSASRDFIGANHASLPAFVDWDRLAGEMRANIQLGLEAGEAIRPREAAPLRLDWRPAFALAALTLVVLTGWYLNVNRRNLYHLPAASVEAGDARIESGPDGLMLTRGGGRMTVMQPAAQAVSYSVNSTGAAMSARTIDTETGQVTISHVYLD